MKNHYAFYSNKPYRLAWLVGMLLASVFSFTTTQGQDYDPTIGINNNTGFKTDMAYVQRTINYDKELGLYRVRMGMDGVGGYNEGDSFNWSARDAVVNKYVAENFKMHCVIAPRAHTNRNVSYDQWKRNYAYFCRAVMTRYKGKITYYIVDNEPDLTYGAPIGPAIPASYAVDFTKIAYDVAASIDPNIRIESAPPTSCETPYLREMVSLGVTRYCHYLGVHVYGGQIDDGRLGKPFEYMAEFSQFPQRPVAASECGVDPAWAPAGLDDNAWQARWFEQFNVQLKRYGYDNILLYRLDESGEGWDILNRPAYTAVKNAYLNKSLTNGGFESGSNLLNPNEWMRTYSADAANAPTNSYRTTSDKRSGTQSLKIDGSGNVRQIIGRLTPGTAVTITAWVRATNGGTARLTLQGYNKTDGDAETVRSTTSAGWTQLSATVTPSNAFLTVELESTGGNCFFDDVAVTTGGGSTPVSNTYEAEASGNTLSDGAQVQPNKVNWMGSVQFNAVSVPSAGSYTLTISYMNGSGGNRSLDVLVNGSSTGAVSCAATGGWETVGTVSKTISLNAGTNTIKLSGNPGPDVDKIRVSNSGARLSFEKTAPETINVYPNPVSRVFTVITGDGLEGQVELLDTNGQMLQAVGTRGGKATVRVEGYASGLYLVKIRTSNGIIVKKLQINR